MEPAGTASRRFPSKFLLTVIPGLVASGVAASVLYAVHVSRAPSVSDYLSEPTPQSDGLSAEERRDLTRQMLKARRENPEQPAEVRPVSGADDAAGAGSNAMDADNAGDPKALDAAGPEGTADTSRTADTRTPAPGAVRTTPDLVVPDIRIPPDAAKALDPRGGAAKTTVDRPAADKAAIDRAIIERATTDRSPPDRAVPDKVPAPPAPDHGVATAPLPLPRPPVVKRPDAPATIATAPNQPLPPPSAAAPALPPPVAMAPPGQPSSAPPPAPPYAPPPAAAGQQAPATLNAPPPQPEQHGFGANMLSGLSSIAGSAANAAGNSVNWVIDLPGKAINAGGKIIGIDSHKNAGDQAGAPPPATAPPRQ